MIKDLVSRFRNISPVIGVVGGGQLAQMLVEAANKRNVEVLVQTGSRNDPAANCASKLILAEPNDAIGTARLGNGCLGVTFENEWVNIEQLSLLEESGLTFFPSIAALRPLVDKVKQRELLKELGFSGTEWIDLNSLPKAPIKLPKEWKFPLMAKLSRGGYDGKGNKVIRNKGDLEELINSEDSNQWFLEKWVPYEKELALVVSRDINGRIRSLPLVETCQSKQVCDWALAPADVPHDVEVFAYNIASSLLTKLNYVGVLALEYFYGPDGLLVNEIAPRTHNSAHLSIEACSSSQFDQQLCIAAKIPVPSTDLVVPGALMVNLLGLPQNNYEPLEDRIKRLREHKAFHFHWYGKNLEKPGRKLGHVTALLRGNDSIARRNEAMESLRVIRSIWPNP